MDFTAVKNDQSLKRSSKYGPSHVGHDVPNGLVPNGSEVQFTTPSLLHKVMSVFTTPRQQ